MQVRARILEPGTLVKIHRPGTGERGVWRITGRVRNSGLDDPAYDLTHMRTGRMRVLRRSRLKLIRRAP